MIPVVDPKALVDSQTRDDAAVYLIDENRALVVTTDFFTPIVDDPADFGRIAAANAFSDIYAMGAKPLFALNLLAFPRELLGEGLVEEIIRGGAEKAQEAGVPILGGHSIDDPEPKYGMVVVGEVDPAEMLTNSAARPGDDLILTKPLGTGIVATAIKAGTCPDRLRDQAVDSMSALNRGAAEAATRAGARSATDVTGYGLVGHLLNMLRAGAVGAEIRASSVPVLDGILELIEAGHVPGGSKRNLADVKDSVSYAADVDQSLRLILSDAQTSGGLLIAVPASKTDDLLGDLRTQSITGAKIGFVTEGPPGTLSITN